MKNMKLSAIVLSLAAAGAFAQAPAAAPAATAQPAPAAAPVAAQPAAAPVAAQPAEAPKAEAVAPAAAPAADAQAVEAAKKAEEEKAAAEAKKAEQEKAAAEAKKAEEEKAAAEAKKAEQEKAAAEAKKAEQEKAAAEAKKAEEEKAAAEAKKAEEAKTAEAKAAPAAETTFLGLNITKADEAKAPTKAVEFKISGNAEFDTYANLKWDDEKSLNHNYASTVDVFFDVKFNENWSARVGIEGDGDSHNPGVVYNGAFVQYQNNAFGVKLGDLSYAEAGFNYYGYDDTGDYAVGITDHDIRGFEFTAAGLLVSLGFARGDDDVYPVTGESGKSYDAHVAYQFDFAGQTLRPFAHYKSYQEADANQLFAGIDAALEFGPFGIHAAYGFQSDRLTEDSPKATHAFLAEPFFKVANVNVKGGVFYALFDEDEPTNNDGQIPEYFFAYGEGDLSLNDIVTIGLVGEYHTNSNIEDTDLASVNFGARFYITPVDGLKITAFGMVILPIGDDWENENHKAFVSTEDYGEDMNLKFGVETVFEF